MPYLGDEVQMQEPIFSVGLKCCTQRRKPRDDCLGSQRSDTGPCATDTCPLKLASLARFSGSCSPILLAWALAPLTDMLVDIMLSPGVITRRLPVKPCLSAVWDCAAVKKYTRN